MNRRMGSCHCGFIQGKFVVICDKHGVVQIYDPNVRVWTTIMGEIGVAIMSHKSLFAFGKLYYFHLNNVIEYDYLDNQVRKSEPYPHEFKFEAATMCGEKMFIYGTMHDKNYFYLFDPSTPQESTQKWTPIDPTLAFCNKIHAIATLKF